MRRQAPARQTGYTGKQGLRNLGPYKVSSGNLSAAWDAAVVKSDGKPLLKQKMKDVLQECKDLSTAHKNAVRKLI